MCVAVAVADGGAGEADKRGVGQCFTHFQRKAFLHLIALYVPVLIAILRSVRLVGHHYDVFAVGECAVAFFKLLNGGEYDAASLAVAQQLLQMLAALGVDRHLAQEVLAAAELTVELVVEVFAVGHHHKRTFGKLLNKLVGEEYHRKTLARTLRVPEHAYFAVAIHGLVGACHGFLHGEVLVIGGEDF